MGYTVRQGDSLESIAGGLSGDQRMFTALVAANKGVGMLKPGMVINEPQAKIAQMKAETFKAEDLRQYQIWKAAKTKQNNATTGAQAAAGPDMTDWQGILGPEVLRLVGDLQAGEDVPDLVLERIEKMVPGVDPNIVISQVLNSVAIKR